MKIGVFDSGIGGKTVLETIKKKLPEAEYRYIADSENCPYGEKPAEELYKIVRKNVEDLREWGASIIVIACNTATVKCIEKLRADYPKLLFVGTEPAVKLALETGVQKILVLATPNTIASERMRLLAAENIGEKQEIEFLACPGLAETIEQYFGVDAGRISDKLEELLVTTDRDYDAVVLGCTHYPLVKDLIADFYPQAQLIDGAEGVARRVAELAEMCD